MLKIERLYKSFGGLDVIKNVSFEVKQGTIHSIIGPNGAGKTTLFNLITGIYKPDQGDVQFRSLSISGKKPHEIARMGISRTFQNIKLFPDMSVMENIMIGQSTRLNIGISSIFPFQGKKQAALREELEQLLELVKLTEKRYMKAKTLAYGEQRRLEIVRALSSGADLLLLDEPAAGMNPDESSELNELITRICNSGKTVLLVEHDMSVVMNISDTVTVINFGQKIAEGSPEDVKQNNLVREAYLGKEEENE
jgi:branched-chain amino acid transport system ATP-binding protein